MNSLWIIGSIHPIYGECTMMGIIDGEAIRWFIDKHSVVSMIPLDVLNYEITS